MSGNEAKRLRQLRHKAFVDQGGLCHWCKTPMKEGDEWQGQPYQCTAEHLRPRHKGGQTVPSNIVAACAKCNCERHPEFNRPKGWTCFVAGDPVSVTGAQGPFGALAVLQEKP